MVEYKSVKKGILSCFTQYRHWLTGLFSLHYFTAMFLNWDFSLALNVVMKPVTVLWCFGMWQCQDQFWAHPASYSMDAADLCSRVQQQWCAANLSYTHSPVSS